jgi:flagellar protein FliL
MAEEKAAEAGEEAPKKKGKLLLIIVAAVLVLTMVGGAAYYFLVIQPAANAAAEGAGDDEDAKPKHAKKGDDEGGETKKKKKKKKKKGEKEEPPAYLVLEPFTVNLADTEQEHFLQVSITLQVPGEAAAEEMKKVMALIRDRCLKTLSSTKSTELRSIEGKQKLADTLVDQIAEAADEDGIEIPEISKVFFTSFIIQ